jgi:hypothetical protein
MKVDIGRVYCWSSIGIVGKVYRSWMSERSEERKRKKTFIKKERSGGERHNLRRWMK